MKYIIFARNPGKQYLNTRHNVGEAYLNFLCKKGLSIKYDENQYFSSYKIHWNNNIYQGFISNYYNINETWKMWKKITEQLNICLKSNMTVVIDDYTLKGGTWKIKIPYKGKNFSHNLFKEWIRESTIKWQYNLLKIGIGYHHTSVSNTNNKDLCSYVLEQFSQEETELLEKAFENILMLKI